MESCLNIIDTYYKSVEEYKIDVDNVIQNMLSKGERMVFALVAEKSEVTRFVIRQYPELRNHILQRMSYYKELNVINQKINRAVNSLLKLNRKLTFIGIANKCNFTSDMIYKNQYIKDRIRSILIQNK